jgi:class 3 adenylate cyclase/tetratricopeptide (TPR) repeat protein
MKCTKCQFENPEKAKYCVQCGKILGFHCYKCGAVTPGGAKFCMECGHRFKEPYKKQILDYTRPKSYTPKFLADKILTTRSSIEGERKLVTVLFADVANYTYVADKLDPEEVHQIMDGIFRILLDEIHRFEGTVNQFTGDGIMALFGAPVAHEDHAQRACHAALSIQKSIRYYGSRIKDRWKVDFSMRIGLNSGLVVVGSIGDDLRMDYTAIGDTTNLAARMEGVAEPGTILVSKDTYRLAKDFFAFQPHKTVEVKGKSEPQKTFQLIRARRVRTRIGAMQARGLTPLAGRKNSMAALQEVYANVKTGAGQVVGLVGEPGVGKSRLLMEFKSLLPVDDFFYLEGRCLHYGESMAYLPILDILKSYFAIEEGDSESQIKMKLEEKILSLNGMLQGAIAPFQELLSLQPDDENYQQLEPQQKRDITFEAIRDLLIRISQEKLLVIAVEDLHWIDKTSEEFLDYLIDWLGNARVLLVLLYRPEYDHRWGSKSYYTRIGINQLGIISCNEMLQVLFEDGEVDLAVNDLILERASGNPLFIEEFTQNLLENGFVVKKEDKYVLTKEVSDIQVPDTIQGLIAARIDRLEENIKRTMQIASVIGRDFAFRILHRISEMRNELKAYLLSLQGLEFIYEKSLFPELEYIFKHALTQEVAYNSLLAGRRKDLHRKVGEAMETIFADRLAEYTSLIGGHFLRGEAWEQAFDYLEKAGDAAARLYSHAEARLHYGRAIEALDHLGDTEENRRRRVDTIIKQTLSSWRADSPERNLRRLSQAEELAKGLASPGGPSEGDSLRLARVHFWLGRVHYSRGEMGDAIGYFSQVLPVAQEYGDRELLSIPSGAIGQAMAVLGRLSEAKQLLGQAIPIFEKAANWTEWIQAKGFRGTAVASMGNYGEGLKEVRQAQARAKELNFLTGVSVSNNCLGYAYLFGGDHPQAIEAAKAAVTAAEQSGDRIYAYVGYGVWGWAACRNGQYEEAASCLARSQEVAKELGGRVIMADLFATAMAEIALGSGRLDEALVLAEQAVTMAQKAGGILAEGIARRLWGQALGSFEAPRWDEAEIQLAESLKVLESGQNRLEAARTHRVWGLLCHDRGNLASASEHWQKAAALFAASGLTRELAEVRELLA